MNSADVVAYAYHAAIYCEACGSTLPEVDPEGNPKSPAFCGYETDSPDHCEACHCLIEGQALTTYGIDYVLDALRDALIQGDGSNCLEDWAREINGYGLEPREHEIVDLYLDRCAYRARQNRGVK